MLSRVGAACLAISLLGGCAPIWATAAPAPGRLVWPAPSNPMELALAAGLAPAPTEATAFHIHAHLDVVLDGAWIGVPAGIGIDVRDPAVHRGQWSGTTSYGGIWKCSKACISPLHTHDQSGVIHIEARSEAPYRLGQFLTEWGAPLNVSAAYVDGKQFGRDPAAIPLFDRAEIVIVIRAPPRTIPRSFPANVPA